ncbi:unnamed protein product [Paramecium sonneborni]|uniref:Uncharacterized protein n=1 Tax=Paramecium sonneborni TaxID=65129 RepID=A0A8S1R1A3_9CILI|nr:unnamed protein product [Paramecium sonneborni]
MHYRIAETDYKKITSAQINNLVEIQQRQSVMEKLSKKQNRRLKLIYQEIKKLLDIPEFKEENKDEVRIRSKNMAKGKKMNQFVKRQELGNRFKCQIKHCLII